MVSIKTINSIIGLVKQINESDDRKHTDILTGMAENQLELVKNWLKDLAIGYKNKSENILKEY